MVDWSTGSYERTARQLETAAAVVVGEAGVFDGEDVLDVACGTGNASLLAARAGARVTGVDSAERLVGVARERASAEGLDATFAVGDALDLPVPDASFDAVVSVFGVIFAQPGQRAADELLRAVRPGGRVVVCSWVAQGPIAAAGRLAAEAVGAAGDAESPAPAPAPAPRSDWGDPTVLKSLFAPATVRVREERLAFTGASPRDWLDEQQRHHPMWIAARAALEPAGRWDELVRRTVEILEAGNEDPGAFRTTSRYLVVTVAPATPGAPGGDGRH